MGLSTLNAALKGVTRVRLLQCTLVVVCFIFLGFLVTTSTILNERFPNIVGIVTGEENSKDFAERASSGRLGRHHPVGRPRTQDLGRTDDSNFNGWKVLVAPAAVAIAPPVVARKKVSLASSSASAAGVRLTSWLPPNGPELTLRQRSEPEAAEESDSEEENQNEHKEDDQEGDEDYFQQENSSIYETHRFKMVDYDDWDTSIGCKNFRETYSDAIRSVSLQS